MPQVMICFHQTIIIIVSLVIIGGATVESRHNQIAFVGSNFRTLHQKDRHVSHFGDRKRNSRREEQFVSELQPINDRLPKATNTVLRYSWKNPFERNDANAIGKQDDPYTTQISATNSATLEAFESFVVPVQGILDNITEGWALSYADLSPDSTETINGQLFLASNTAYLIAGAYLAATGDFWLGMCTEVVAVASFNYHYQQLMNTGSVAASSVRNALLIDYCFAFLSIGTANLYLLSLFPSIPVAGIAVGIAAFICLGCSWIWEYGRPYMVWHSLWHILSAISGYLIGSEHYMRMLQ